MTETIMLRRVTPDDVPIVVRFGSLMFQSMGETDMSWMPNAEQVLRQGLSRGQMMAVVAEDQERHDVVSSAVGVQWDRLPSPNNHSGRGGYVQYVWTEPDFRGLGLARRVLMELIDWFREVGVANVDLHATSVAEPIYRAIGFAEMDNAALRLHL